MKPPLTDRQAEILAFVKLYIAKHRYPPTRQDICDGFGFSSPNAAEQHLKALVAKGRIRTTPRVSRGLVVL